MDYREDALLQDSEFKQKVSLRMASKAEDTLKSLWLSKDTSGHTRSSDTPSNSRAESPPDGSGSEDSVMSGPSSPTAAFHLLTCRKCVTLFTKIRRPGHPSKKERDNNPSSLSCDEWLLNKAWHPQRRQQSRGRLWVHLKRIRLRAVTRADDGMVNKSWAFCFRPHVFLLRNLRRCKKLSGKGRAKPVVQRRNRARSKQSEKYQRQKKRKSSEEDDTSEHRTQSVSDMSGFLDIQANGGGLEGTRRVLKFDPAPSAVLTETQKPQQRLVHRSARAKLHKDQADFDEKNGDRPGDPKDVFRTSAVPDSADLKITRKSGGSRKDSFRTMLAALGQRHNPIIKESDHGWFSKGNLNS